MAGPPPEDDCDQRNSQWAEKNVPTARNLTNVDGVRAQILSVPKNDPGVMIVGMNDRDPQFHDIFKVDIATGERTLLRENTDQVGFWIFDMDGNLKWKKGFGVLDSGFFRVPDAQWGFASSPVLYEDRVVIQADVQGQSFLACFDVSNGKQIWRTKLEVELSAGPGVGEGRVAVAADGVQAGDGRGGESR